MVLRHISIWFLWFIKCPLIFIFCCSGLCRFIFTVERVFMHSWDFFEGLFLLLLVKSICRELGFFIRIAFNLRVRLLHYIRSILQLFAGGILGIFLKPLAVAFLVQILDLTWIRHLNCCIGTHRFTITSAINTTLCLGHKIILNFFINFLLRFFDLL
jgi:hypothetical protein